MQPLTLHMFLAMLGNVMAADPAGYKAHFNIGVKGTIWIESVDSTTIATTPPSTVTTTPETAPGHEWVELRTTFGKNNPQPRTKDDAEKAGWIKIEDSTDRNETRFAGAVRYFPPMAVPDKVLIYDDAGDVVGFQSGTPESDLVPGNNCSMNPYYTRDIIAGEKASKTWNTTYCLITVYFQDPRKIGTENDAVKELHVQIGESWENDSDLVRIPRKLSEVEANPDEWEFAAAPNSTYFPGMGHHTNKKNLAPDDCLGSFPIQVLYALDDNQECTNSGFVSGHYAATDGTGWEKPPAKIIQMVKPTKLPKCMIEYANKGKIRTMHTFLAGSTKKCY